MTHRETSNANQRGSSSDRRARKLWLLKKYAIAPGIALCCFCAKWLHFDIITVDRIVPGCQGGKYTRDNIRPACGRCNARHGSQIRANAA